MIATLLGGVGIFLVGMILLTEGVKAGAGDALRGWLQRFTRGPGSAVLSGAAVTAVVQSSSATTLTTIGFVSAGLLSFPQALGVILGSNVGTTSTGWIVSLLGLKVQVSLLALPLVGVGALTRLVGRGRLAAGGMAIAGFGLIFVGIDVLQAAMEGVAQRFDPGSFPGATLWGRLALVGLGAVMTVVMQSSSAAVATTLTALHSGAIGLDQAAVLVVGQNVGTTAKAALAALGASVPARRTAVAHILFNFGTGALALGLLPVLLPLTVRIAGEGDPAVAIALFHTTFNVLGVAVALPLLGPFAAAVERMVPERVPSLTRHLDRSVAELPAVAVEAARRAALAVALVLFRGVATVLHAQRPERDVEEVEEALIRIREFLGWVRPTGGGPEDFARHLSVLHAVDHLDRLAEAFRDLRRAPLAGRAAPPELASEAERARLELARKLRAVEGEALGSPEVAALSALSREMAETRKGYRAALLEATARGALDPERARDEIERIKRLDRVGYHAWRAAVHLGVADATSVPEVFEDRESEL